MTKRRVVRHPVTQPDDTSYRLIPLTQNQNAIVDTQDYAWLSQWSWRALWNKTAKTYYAVRSIGTRRTHRNDVRMHRLILGCSSEEEGDHKNHNGLDNRRTNLRKATKSRNAANGRLRSDNLSGFRGVSFDKERRLWAAYITLDQKRRHLGRYATKEEAARAYDAAACKHFGEFALTNFPD